VTNACYVFPLTFIPSVFTIQRLCEYRRTWNDTTNDGC